MSIQERAAAIQEGKATLGIEFGSTRIKAVLIDETNEPIASGGFEWENSLVDGIWTYDVQDVWKGLHACYADLKANIQKQYGVRLEKLAGIGISAMMHGYLAFDGNDKLLVLFRTWRNTITGKAADELTHLFNFNIPQRWSIAHLYQAILNGEAHVPQVRYITTLAGYVHWQLTGEKVISIGDASGMFPIDSEINDYSQRMLDQFDELVAPKGYSWKIRDLLPKVLVAGDCAGKLTEAGARMLDADGDLCPGVPLCPPEGDAGTGMTATNSVAVHTGNVSAGTSIFAMVVLEKALSQLHTEIDMVTTPSGKPVAMAHCNNGTTDLNGWVGLFGEFAAELGMKLDPGKLYGTLYRKALEGDKDAGGLVHFNYDAGEALTDISEGRPLFIRKPDSNYTLANFMRSNLYGALATLKIGMDILLVDEKVRLDTILGHGGLFKTKGVGQAMMAAAINTPVSVMETAGEGGAWGIALLAAYMTRKADGETLEAFLNDRVFSEMSGETLDPDPEDVKGFEEYMRNYKACLAAERAAVENYR